jgi:hypothetical protein
MTSLEEDALDEAALSDPGDDDAKSLSTHDSVALSEIPEGDEEHERSIDRSPPKIEGSDNNPSEPVAALEDEENSFFLLEPVGKNLTEAVDLVSENSHNTLRDVNHDGDRSTLSAFVSNVKGENEKVMEQVLAMRTDSAQEEMDLESVPYDFDATPDDIERGVAEPSGVCEVSFNDGPEGSGSHNAGLSHGDKSSLVSPLKSLDGENAELLKRMAQYDSPEGGRRNDEYGANEDWLSPVVSPEKTVHESESERERERSALFRAMQQADGARSHLEGLTTDGVGGSHPSASEDDKNINSRGHFDEGDKSGDERSELMRRMALNDRDPWDMEISECADVKSKQAIFIGAPKLQILRRMSIMDGDFDRDHPFALPRHPARLTEISSSTRDTEEEEEEKLSVWSELVPASDIDLLVADYSESDEETVWTSSESEEDEDYVEIDETEYRREQMKKAAARSDPKNRLKERFKVLKTREQLAAEHCAKRLKEGMRQILMALPVKELYGYCISLDIFWGDVPKSKREHLPGKNYIVYILKTCFTPKGEMHEDNTRRVLGLISDVALHGYLKEIGQPAFCALGDPRESVTRLWKDGGFMPHNFSFQPSYINTNAKAKRRYDLGDSEDVSLTNKQLTEDFQRLKYAEASLMSNPDYRGIETFLNAAYDYRRIECDFRNKSLEEIETKRLGMLLFLLFSRNHFALILVFSLRAP